MYPFLIKAISFPHLWTQQKCFRIILEGSRDPECFGKILRNEKMCPQLCARVHVRVRKANFPFPP